MLEMNAQPYVTIILFAVDGTLAARERIPAYGEWPDVILWCDRIFKHSTLNHYVECFAFSIPYREAFGTSEQSAPPAPGDSRCPDIKNGLD